MKKQELTEIALNLLDAADAMAGTKVSYDDLREITAKMRTLRMAETITENNERLKRREVEHGTTGADTKG